MPDCVFSLQHVSFYNMFLIHLRGGRDDPMPPSLLLWHVCSPGGVTSGETGGQVCCFAEKEIVYKRTGGTGTLSRNMQLEAWGSRDFGGQACSIAVFLYIKHLQSG